MTVKTDHQPWLIRGDEAAYFADGKDRLLLYIYFALIWLNNGVKAEPGHVHQVISHDIAPTDLVMKHRHFGELTILSALFFIIIVLAVVLGYPFFKQVHFGRLRKNDLEKSFLAYLFQVVVHVMVVLMAMADDLGGYHITG